MPPDAPIPAPPGFSVPLRGIWRALYPFWVLVFAVGFVLGSALRPDFLREGAAVVALLLIGAALLFVLLRAERVLDRHRRGQAGEEKTARALAALPPDWTSFHNVPLPDGRDADHVVIGPAGVFLIETINWPGRITVEEGKLCDDGKSYPGHSLAALRERAAALAALLELENVPVVVCAAGGRLAPMPNPFQGVWFAEPHTLADLLRRIPGVSLDASRRQALAARLLSPP